MATFVGDEPLYLYNAAALNVDHRVNAKFARKDDAVAIRLVDSHGQPNHVSVSGDLEISPLEATDLGLIGIVYYPDTEPPRLSISLAGNSFDFKRIGSPEARATTAEMLEPHFRGFIDPFIKAAGIATVKFTFMTLPFPEIR